MYEIWVKRNYKLTKIEETDEIKNINIYKRGVYEFVSSERPRCKICGSDLKFIKIGKKLIIDKCLNDNCETNNKSLKKGAPIKWKAFVPEHLLKEASEKKSASIKYSFTIDKYINDGFSEEEAKELIKKRRNKLIENGKKLGEQSSKQNLINKYGEEETERILKERSCLCIEHYIKQGWTEEDAKKRISEIQKKNSSKVKIYKGLTKEIIKNLGYDVELFFKEKSCWCIEYYLKRGYSEVEAYEQIKELQRNNSKLVSPSKFKERSIKCIEHWTKMGYTEDEAKRIISANQNTFSKEKCIKKYGEQLGLDIFRKRQEKWQLTLHNNKKLHCGYSKISQELFNELKKYTNNEIYYGSLNREYSIYNVDNKHAYVYDYTDITNKKIIEFQGDVYHANPKLFNENDKPSPWTDLTAKEIWNKDEFKKQVALNNNFDVLYIWEFDYRENKEKIILECIKFLNYDK